MLKTYKNPPLLEAVCEFRFVTEGNYSAEQITSFYEMIKGSFPIQKKGKINQIEFKIDAEKTPEENKGSISQDFYEFERLCCTIPKNPPIPSGIGGFSVQW